MRIIYKSALIAFTLLINYSCITTQRVPIDQLEPGKISLPVANRKVALITRNFKFSYDTLAGYYNLNFRLHKGKDAENRLIDSLAVAKSIENLRKALLESGRFDEVFVYPSNALKPYSAPNEQPLSQGFIKSVCSESVTDAVISLEMLSYFYSRHSRSADFDAGADVKVTSIWSIYTPDKEGPIDRFTHSEKLKWHEMDPQEGKKYDIPSRKDAVAQACAIAAKNYSKRIVPHWVESSRLLIALDEPLFVKALTLAKKNKWKDAAKLWEGFLNSKRSRVAGIAALNYAVAQEMLGDPDQALLWSKKSVDLLKNGAGNKISRGYNAVLYERMLTSARLNKQLKPARP